MVELIDTDSGQVARIFPPGENMPYQKVQHINTSSNGDQLRFISRTKRLSRKVLIAVFGAMSLRNWLSGVSLVTLIGALAISGCSSKDSGEQSGGQGKLMPQEKGSASTKPVHKEVGAGGYGKSKKDL